MGQIIYQSPKRDEEYLIDEDSQQLLAYLYLYSSSHPNELADRLNYESEEDVVELIKNKLSKGKAGFVTLRRTDQLDLEYDQVSEVSITKNGQRFVRRYKSDIPVPFSVHTFIQEMESIEKNIEQKIRDVVNRSELYDEGEQTPENIEELMENVEDSFDEIRNKRL